MVLVSGSSPESWKTVTVGAGATVVAVVTVVVPVPIGGVVGVQRGTVRQLQALHSAPGW